MLCQTLKLGSPGASPKPRGFLHCVQSSPSHPILTHGCDEALVVMTGLRFDY